MTSIPEDWTIFRVQEDDGERLDFAAITITPTGGRPRRTAIIPMADVSTPQRLIGAIKDIGGNIPAGDAAALAKAVADTIPEDAGILARTTGWKRAGSNIAHISQRGVIGELGVPLILDQRLQADGLAVGTAGTLQSWKKSVARPAVDSAYASLLIMVSLSGAARYFSQIPEGFIINLFGNGSGGKTTASRAAASVWGPPARAKTWLSTPTGLIHYAAANSDMALVVDDAELADFDPKKRLDTMRQTIHMFAAGVSKLVARSARDQLPDLKFRVVVVSTSPKSVRQDAFERGQDLTLGELARLLEVAVPDGDFGGIWQAIDGSRPSGSTAAMSKAMRASADLHHGTAGPAFVRYLVDHAADVPSLLLKYAAKLELPVETSEIEVKGRIGDKVRFIYASARMARDAGILDWSKDHLKAVAQFAYRSIVHSAFPEARGVLEVLRPLAAISKNKEFFPRHDGDLSKFSMPDGAIGVVANRQKPSARLYVKREELRARLTSMTGHPIASGHFDRVLELLTTAGALLAGDGGGSTRTVRLAEGKKVRFLTFDIDSLKEFLVAHDLPLT